MNSQLHASLSMKIIAVLTVYAVILFLILLTSLSSLFNYTTLKATIESCLKHGLKKNLFKKCTTYNLLIKLGKECEAAKNILEICNQIEINYLSMFNQKNKLNESNLADSMISLQTNDFFSFNKSALYKHFCQRYIF